MLKGNLRHTSVRIKLLYSMKWNCTELCERPSCISRTMPGYTDVASLQPLDRYGLWHMCRGLNHPNTAVMGQKTETTHPHHSQTISSFAMKTDWTHGFASHCFAWNWQCPPKTAPRKPWVSNYLRRERCGENCLIGRVSLTFKNCY